MIYFDEVDVLINNTGIYCDSATIGSENNLLPVYSIGNSRGQFNPNGPIKHNLSLSYLLSVDQDPSFAIASGIKELTNDSSYTPITIEVNNLTGFYLLKSYSMAIRPNDLVRVNAQYESYWEMSGDFGSQTYSGDYKDHTRLAHGNVTYLSTDLSYSEMPIYSIGYDFSAEWRPQYSMGKKYPVDKKLISASERIDIEKDTYTKIEFSGQEATNSFLANTTTGLDFMTLNTMCFSEYDTGVKPFTGDYVNMSINLSGFRIIQSDVEAQINDLMSNRVSMRKFY